MSQLCVKRHTRYLLPNLASCHNLDDMTTQQIADGVPEFSLGDRLRKAREKTGLSIREFAEEIGVSHGTITNAEGDKRGVRPITLKAYALRTKVPLVWLETGNAPARPEPDGGKWAHWESNPEPAGLKLRLVAVAA